MRPPTRQSDFDAGWVRTGGLSLLVIAGVALTALAARLQGMPPDLAPTWLACGLAIGPLVRWSFIWAVPAVVTTLVAGSWLGGVLDVRTALLCAVTAIQCAAVAWGLRRSLPVLMADRRPPYRVRLALQGVFLFKLTLPASLAVGVLVTVLDAASGDPWRQALHTGLQHASASALSIAVLAPLMWWDTLRVVSWSAVAAAVVAAVAVTVLYSVDGWFFWLAPLVVFAAGYFGSTWTAALTVACFALGLMMQSRRELLLSFDGPDGFVIWMLVVWRLLGTGLLAAVWSDRRIGFHKISDARGKVYPTTASAWQHWRVGVHGGAEWLVVLLDRLLPDDADCPAEGVSAGASLRVRGALERLAALVRHGDVVVGSGRSGAILLLKMSEGIAPSPESLRLRCTAATHPAVELGLVRSMPSAQVSFLLASAAHLDGETDAP